MIFQEGGPPPLDPRMREALAKRNNSCLLTSLVKMPVTFNFRMVFFSSKRRYVYEILMFMKVKNSMLTWVVYG